MRSLLIVGLCAGLGTAAPYDISAIPDAAAAREKALLACQGRAFPSLQTQVDCGLEAHRLYAVTEKLQPMSLFRDYAGGVRKAVAAADKGQLSQTDLQKKLASLRTSYDGAVAKLYADYKKAHPRTGAPFDRGPWANGSRVRDQAVGNCGTWDNVTTISVRISCVLAAEKTFTSNIALKDMDLFYGYASFLRVDAVDAEAGRFQPPQLRARHERLWSDFLHTLDQDYRDWERKPQSTTATGVHDQ